MGIINSSSSRRRILGRAVGVIGVGALVISLAACSIADFVGAEITCTAWTLTPKNFSGTVTHGHTGSGIWYQPVVIDGNRTVIYSAEPSEVWTNDGTPEVATFDLVPTANPIIAGVYTTDGGPIGEGDQTLFVGHCDELPLAASVALAPSQTTPTRGMPSFDVRFSEAVTGFDVTDLVIGGTSNPTDATIALIQSGGVPNASGYSESPVEDVIRAYSSIYRVTITGVANDGTVTLSVPAGVVVDGFDDTNAATGIATATVDTTGPSLGAVADITRQLTPGQTSIPVTWVAPTATDLSGTASRQCTPASGSDFTAGDTLVTCTATDTLGNDSATDFTVGVLAAQTPLVTLVQQNAGATAQGGSSTFTLTATDYTGATVPLAASDYTVTSSVPSDVIETSDGSFTVTFPHASPHTLTVTQTSTSTSTQLTIQVTPTAIPERAGSTRTALSQTGADIAAPVTIAGAALAIGFLLLIAARVRRRGDRARTSRPSRR